MAEAKSLGMKYTPPSDEQLARFAVVRTDGQITPAGVDLALRMFKLTPSIRDGWLRLHRAFQEAACSATSESEES